jgi:hypothetical protein
MEEKHPELWLNGFKIIAKKPGEFVSAILSSVPDLQFWSYEALKELYVGTYDIVSEFCHVFGRIDKKKYSSFARFPGRVKARMQYIPDTQPEMLEHIYHAILSSEGLPLLKGFGVVNRQGDWMPGNPETKPLDKFGKY